MFQARWHPAISNHKTWRSCHIKRCARTNGRNSSRTRRFATNRNTNRTLRLLRTISHAISVNRKSARITNFRLVLQMSQWRHLLHAWNVARGGNANGMQCASGSVAKCNGMRERECNGMQWNAMNKNNYIVKDVSFIFYYVQNLLSLLYNAVFMVLYYKSGWIFESPSPSSSFFHYEWRR